MHCFAPLLVLASLLSPALAATAPKTYAAPKAIKFKAGKRFNTTLGHGVHPYHGDHPLGFGGMSNTSRKALDLKLSKTDAFKSSACPDYRDQTMTIEVHYRVHYYSDANGSKRREDGYLSEALIMANLAQLNKDYSAAVPRIRFILGTGTTKQTAGITYTVFTDKTEWDAFVIDPPYSQESLDRVGAVATNARGPVSSRPPNSSRQFFVYMVKAMNGGTIGFAIGANQTPDLYDGVYYSQEFFQANTDDYHHYPSTLAHEVGHWSGLLHSFQGGCGAANSLLDGDMVSDTPKWGEATEVGNYLCPGKEAQGYTYAGVANMCGGTKAQAIANIANIMSYSTGGCMTKFTLGQFRRFYGYAVYGRGIPTVCGAAS